MSLKTNPSQVRKMIAQLRAADILAARQNNRYDNFARDLDQITVLDVYRATAPKNPFLVQQLVDETLANIAEHENKKEA